VATVPARALHPLHAILIAFPVALFAFALAADITYLNTAEMQWSNLAAWAITGALLMGAPAVAWAAVRWLRHRRTAPRATALVLGLLGGAWIAGLVNAFKHSQDAWSSVGAFGLVLSILSTALALAAAWIAHSGAEYRS
jgi:uncharacterized membrane protein